MDVTPQSSTQGAWKPRAMHSQAIVLIKALAHSDKQMETAEEGEAPADTQDVLEEDDTADTNSFLIHSDADGFFSRQCFPGMYILAVLPSNVSTASNVPATMPGPSSTSRPAGCAAEAPHELTHASPTDLECGLPQHLWRKQVSILAMVETTACDGHAATAVSAHCLQFNTAMPYAGRS